MISSFLSMTSQKNLHRVTQFILQRWSSDQKLLTLAFSKIWEGTFSPIVSVKRDKKCCKRFFQEKPSSSIKSRVPDQLELVETNLTFIPALKK